MAGIDQVIPDYRAQIVGGTGPDIGAGRDTSGYQRIWVSHYRPISLSLSRWSGTGAWGLSRLSPVPGILTPISQSSRPLSLHRTGIPVQTQIRNTWDWDSSCHDAYPIERQKSNAANDIIIHSLKQIVIELQITSIWYLILIEIFCGAACTCCSFCKPCLDKAAKGERVIIWALLFTIPRYLFLKYAGRPSVDVR